tara:strand:- start:1369 stop:1938 length:570 start_codon:yes stop_codon:yes gene_type:complete
MELPEHLGGHCNKTHLDRGALLWAAKELGVKTLIDVGCGPGGMVELANSLGIESFGIDGDFTLDRGDIPCLVHDYTLGPCETLGEGKYDLAWSVEFLEHVEESYMANYMDSYQKCKYVICTHAPLGCLGIHHVNCQDEDYWVEKFKSFGFSYDRDLTYDMRSASTMNIHMPFKKQFVKKTGKVFVNEAP